MWARWFSKLDSLKAISGFVALYIKEPHSLQSLGFVLYFCYGTKSNLNLVLGR